MRYGWWVGLAVAVALVLSGTGRLQARQEKGEHPAGPKAEAAHEAHGPQGQDKIFAPAFELTIWTILVFCILLFVLGKYAWGPMMQGLESREKAIHAAVEEAQKAREETARLRDEVARERIKAEEEARAMIDQARRDAQKQGDELRAKAMAEIQSERERLRRDLDLARDQALQQLWERSAELATQVAARVLPRKMNSDDHRQLMDEAIVELRRVGEERKKEAAGV